MATKSRTRRSPASRSRNTRTTPMKPAPKASAKQTATAALKAVEREGKRLGRKLATRFKGIETRKLVAAAAAAVGIGAAAVGALAARRKAKRRKRLRLR